MKHLKKITHEHPGMAMMGLGLLKGMMGSMGEWIDSMGQWMGSAKEITGS